MTPRSPPFLALLLMAPAGASQAADDALHRFLHAEDGDAARAVAADVLADDVPFDEALSRLRAGRDYSADVPRRRLLRSRTDGNGVRHPYLVLVPEAYTPERTWPVRMNLHGGMGHPEWEEVDGAWAPGWEPTSDSIVILPAGWWGSMWWQASQVENLEAILGSVKRTYNVDENRVVMYGSSDGCVGGFFYAFRHPDRWAGYAGYVGSPDRLTNRELLADGQMHLSNLTGQRFLLGYGGRDPLNPIRHVERYMELLRPHAAQLDWFVNRRDAHDLRMTPEQMDALVDFLYGTVRDPLPDRVSWSTERVDRYARRSWLVIDELEAPDDAEPDRDNILPRWGSRTQLRWKAPEPVPWGRVELERDDNTIRATTRRVQRFTLLLSPDEIDFAQPVTVLVDGRRAFHGPVEPSVEVLLDWAARDDDRTLLFGAELTIDVDRPSEGAHERSAEADAAGRRDDG